MNGILIALAVVAVVGLIAGVLLALASHFFRVEVDETFVKVRECLPGVNCGACGYTGCDEYAKAIAENGEKPNLCVPGGDSCAKDIAEIMGVEAESADLTVAFVHCNRSSHATSRKARYQGISTCRAAAMYFAGPEECRFGCIGLGDCAVACPTDAICIRDGVARVNSELCIGCGLCAKTCPKEIISLVPVSAKTTVMCNSKDKGAMARKACANACIACKKCEKTCPEGAITVIDNLATIDYSKCTNCGACADVCPTGCIKKVDFSKKQVG